MAGSYDSFLSELQPSADDRQSAITRALMMAAAAAFANNGQPMGSVLGQTLFSGMKGFDDSMGQSRKDRADKFNSRKQAYELQQLQQADEDKKSLAEAMRAAAASRAPAAPPAAPGTTQSMAFTPEVNAGLPAPAAPPAPSSARDQERRMLQATIDGLISKGAGHLVGPLQDRLAKMDPKYSSNVNYDQQGRAFVINETDGKPQYLGDVKARDEIVADNLGGTTQYRTKYDTKPLAAAPHTMTPGEVDASRRGNASLNLQREQFDRGRKQYDSERGGMVNLDTAAFTPATQGGAPLAPKMPEAQKKELMDIDKQVAQVRGAIDAAQKTPSAFGRVRGAATLGGAVSETVAGGMDSPPEREARAYVFNIVSSAIKERAGTAQSPSELARLRSFLPAEMDTAEQVANKLQGYEKYLLDSRGAVSQPISATPPERAQPAQAQAAPAAEPTATGPNGMKLVFRGGKWQPLR